MLAKVGNHKKYLIHLFYIDVLFIYLLYKNIFDIFNALNDMYKYIVLVKIKLFIMFNHLVALSKLFYSGMVS